MEGGSPGTAAGHAGQGLGRTRGWPRLQEWHGVRRRGDWGDPEDCPHDATQTPVCPSADYSEGPQSSPGWTSQIWERGTRKGRKERRRETSPNHTNCCCGEARRAATLEAAGGSIHGWAGPCAPERSHRRAPASRGPSERQKQSARKIKFLQSGDRKSTRLNSSH